MAIQERGSNVGEPNDLSMEGPVPQRIGVQRWNWVKAWAQHMLTTAGHCNGGFLDRGGYITKKSDARCHVLGASARASVAKQVIKKWSCWLSHLPLNRPAGLAKKPRWNRPPWRSDQDVAHFPCVSQNLKCKEGIPLSPTCHSTSQLGLCKNPQENQDGFNYT